MSSVPKRPTILDRIDGGWKWHKCECGRYIDVTWIPRDDDPTAPQAGESFFDSHYSHCCPECIKGAVPDDQKSCLAAIYRRIRGIRRDLGLGKDEPEAVVRTALGGYWGSQTLHMFMWFPLTSRGKARDGPYIEHYFIVGGIVHDEGNVPDPAEYSQFPVFELDPITPTFTIATVYLADIGRHTAAPGGEIRWAWNPLDPGSPTAQELHVSRLTPQQRETLLVDVMRLYDKAPRRGGRRRGTGQFKNADAVEQALRAAIRALRAAGQTATQATVGEYIAAQATTRRAIMGDAPADPDRRVRRLCTDHGLDWQDLLREP